MSGVIPRPYKYTSPHPNGRFNGKLTTQFRTSVAKQKLVECPLLFSAPLLTPRPVGTLNLWRGRISHQDKIKVKLSKKSIECSLVSKVLLSIIVSQCHNNNNLRWSCLDDDPFVILPANLKNFEKLGADLFFNLLVKISLYSILVS